MDKSREDASERVPSLVSATDAPSRAEAIDDMEQVRQLLLGDHQAAQERELTALRERVSQLEATVEALIVHGEASRTAWQNDVVSVHQRAERESGSRTVAQQVTPLTPRPNGAGSRNDD